MPNVRQSKNAREGKKFNHMQFGKQPGCHLPQFKHNNRHNPCYNNQLNAHPPEGASRDVLAPLNHETFPYLPPAYHPSSEHSLHNINASPSMPWLVLAVSPSMHATFDTTPAAPTVLRTTHCHPHRMVTTQNRHQFSKSGGKRQRVRRLLPSWLLKTSKAQGLTQTLVLVAFVIGEESF